MTVIGHAGLWLSGESAAVNPDDTSKAVIILVYLALVSSVAYTIWGLLLKKNDVSKISIFGFMTPVLGVVLSALLLGEGGQLGIRHIVSLVFITAGIIVVNLKKEKYYKRFLGKTLLQKGYSPNPFPKTLNDFYPPMVLSIGG